MKSSNRYALIFALLFLLLLHSIGTLVESIYILDLLKTSLDEKALGLLFLFSPVFLLLLKRRPSRALIWLLFVILFIGRGLIIFLPTAGRLLASGLASAAALFLFPLLINTQSDGERPTGQAFSLGLALAVGASILLRTLGYGIDYSLQTEGGWLGWVLGLGLGYALRRVAFLATKEKPASAREALLPLLGVWMVFALVYFAFSAPSVLARWAESDYRMTVFLISLLCLIWVGGLILRPTWIEDLSPTLVLIWNLLFTLALTTTLLVNRVAFPPSPDSPPLIVGAASWQQQAPYYLTLLLFPVIFLDLSLLTEPWKRQPPSLPALAAGMLLGVFVLVLLMFMQIFTNVWGYVEPVSPWFRNQFWLPYFLMSALLTLAVIFLRPRLKGAQRALEGNFSPNWLVLFVVLLGGSVAAAFVTTQVRQFTPRPNSLIVLTYNLQQGNDSFGERSYQRQLALMKQIDADIIALQESDSARVSLNNTDLVRYFAGKLRYYSYYGPGPISGTYGTAILSKYPLYNPHIVFSYSDQDEIGTAVAEIQVDGRWFTIYNVHPDGSDTAMMVFAQSLLEQIGDKPYVIALGDYNLRDDEPAYQVIAARLTNVWESLYPTKISPQGIDMSGRNRIDHIFLSAPLRPRWATYVLPPDSATDHPVHWAEIVWEE
ncbi:MAG: endonuclease/exonuclease/phosphatase family protein [Anaerolineales bacterium]|nr:endonuclease/exonuclease/phosphatase family protein [Anaerolineales bacterium]